MIKFITEQEKTKQLTFGDVAEDQFFVDGAGYLCQKIDDDSYISIADNQGRPEANTYKGIVEWVAVKRILPKVTKIEF